MGATDNKKNKFLVVSIMGQASMQTVAKRAHDIDVAIVGGGPAGCAVALALDPSLSCLVVDPLDAASVGIGETLPPGVQPLLERLGVWSAFLEQEHMPAHGTAACWGSAQLEDHPFLFHPFGSGWHLDRTRFDALLRSRVRLVGGRGLELADGTQLRARFIVDATGRKMAIARARGAECVAWDRGIARFARYSSHGVDTTTLIEAVHDGWWYSTTVPGGDLIVARARDRTPHRRRAAHPAMAMLGSRPSSHAGAWRRLARGRRRSAGRRSALLAGHLPGAGDGHRGRRGDQPSPRW
jgi:2-polyprenyl-6-methoxyphenol hydroxylase-like FAD-dependent oxidoreductase